MRASFARDCARIARKWLASAVAPMLTGNTGGDRFHHSAIRRLGFWLWDWRLGRTDPTGPAGHLQGTDQEIFYIRCCTRQALLHFPRRPRERTECSSPVSGSVPSFAAPRQGINPLPKNNVTVRHGSIRNCACCANLRVVVCLGRIAFDGLLAHQQRAGHLFSRSAFVFGHGAECTLPSGLIAIASYHPSLQNTNTGKLTRPMLLAIFKRARQLSA